MVPILALIAALWMGTAGAAQRVELVDEVYSVPANEWRYIDFSLRQLPVTISGEYTVSGTQPGARLLLIRLPEPRRVREHHLRNPVAETPFAVRGRLQHHVRTAGHYVVVIDNRGRAVEAAVHLRIGLDFGPQVTYLSQQRRLTVILVSFAVFFAVVGWSARRLMKTLR
jgi:hypothetical protein